MLELRNALVAIGDADTGVGGLVPLCNGNVAPIIYRRTLATASTPRVTFFFLPSGEGTQSGKRIGEVQAVCWTHPTDIDEYLEQAELMRRRLKAIWTGPQLTALGVDAAPLRPRLFDVSGGEDDDGTVGLGLELTFFNVQ